MTFLLLRPASAHR